MRYVPEGSHLMVGPFSEPENDHIWSVSKGRYEGRKDFFFSDSTQGKFMLYHTYRSRKTWNPIQNHSIAADKAMLVHAAGGEHGNQHRRDPDQKGTRAKPQPKGSEGASFPKRQLTKAAPVPKAPASVVAGWRATGRRALPVCRFLLFFAVFFVALGPLTRSFWLSFHFFFLPPISHPTDITND